MNIVLGIFAALAVLFTALPAQAINIPGCGEFLIFAKDRLEFDGGAVITGDVMLTNPAGIVKTGARTIIKGTLSANKIIVGSASIVDVCVANVVELLGGGAATGQCKQTIIGFTPAAACTASFPPPPLTAPNVPLTVNTAPNITVPAGATQTLGAGTYREIRVLAGATLNLDPGAVLDARNVILFNGATLQSLGARATVNTLLTVFGDANSTFRNLNLNIQDKTGNAFSVYNNTIIDNTVVNSPNGNSHPRTGTQLRGDSELVSKDFLFIESITNTPPQPDDVECTCPTGTTLKPGANAFICVP